MKRKLFFLLILLSLISLVATYWVVIHETTSTINDAVGQSTQAANATVTKMLANDVYPRIAKQLALEGNVPSKPLTGDDFLETDRLIRQVIFGTDIMKVKIYDLKGMTLYSTETNQIGQDQYKNPSLTAAYQGEIGTQITHRGKFHAADGEVYDRDLVSSYVPLRNKAGSVIGVAEIYTDRTPLLIKTRDGGSPVRPHLLLMQAIQLLLLALLGWAGWSLRGEAARQP